MLPLGHTLYLWRLEKGLSQVELARKSHVSRPNLSAIEHGGRDVTVGTLRRLSRALGLRAGILVDGIAPPALEVLTLGRESLDRIARSILEEPVRLSREEAAVTKAMKVLLKNKLRFVKLGGRLPRTVKEEEKALLEMKACLGHQQFKNILSRVEKMMGSRI